jgi:type II secretory pathway pseudopilin PulG
MQLSPRPRSARSGFSLVDVCVALAILATALGTLVGTVFWSMRLDEVNEESAAASQSLRALLEGMNAMSVEEVYASYNDDTADDPIPGRNYLAELVVDDPLLVIGKKTPPEVSVSFPDDVVDELAENRLPITLRVQWEGSSGTRSVELTTLLRNP